MQFSVTILGSNSALPTSHRNPTAQLLHVAERFFLIDCGEGTQLQLRKNKIKFTRINHIFISHLHGDHCFGLIGFISTLGLLQRTIPLTIYAHADLERLLRPHLDYFCNELPFEVCFVNIDPSVSETIYSDDKIQVKTIPLRHRVPTCGFLFEEISAEKCLNKSALKNYSIPVRDLEQIKNGANWTSLSGEVILNEQLTISAHTRRSYAFCSDTQYCPDMSSYIKEVTLLYHEATFLDELKEFADKSSHSTSLQAAQTALDVEAKALTIGHFSSRYRNVTPLLTEAQTIFPQTFEAKEGRTFFLHNSGENLISFEDII